MNSGSVVYNAELWLYKLKYGVRANLHGKGGSYHKLQVSIITAQIGQHVPVTYYLGTDCGLCPTWVG